MKKKFFFDFFFRKFEKNRFNDFSNGKKKKKSGKILKNLQES